jgi:Flp pilus assembly pilin Flp
MTNVTATEEPLCASSVCRNLVLGTTMTRSVLRLWTQDEGQDVAEYAVMLAVVLVLTMGTVRLIGANANNVFSSIASAIQ